MTVESLTTSEPQTAHGRQPVGLLARAADDDAVPAVVITGFGLLTPLGRTANETWDALLAGRHISDHSRSAGEFDRFSPRVIQMARHVAEQAIADAGWETDDFATVVGTSKGSVESWLTPLQHMDVPACEAGDSGRAVIAPAVTGLADIAASLGLGGGPKLTVSAACASGLHALIRGVMMIRSGEARRVLVVAAEASVHPLFLGSFKRLGVLPTAGVGCRPFDEGRDGFLMSEAAAGVCVEAAPETSRRGLEEGFDRAAIGPSASPQPRTRVAVERFGLGADAAHLTAGDPDGTVLTHLINRVCGDEPVDLIHAHGTGTPTNDPIELAAIEAAVAGSSSTPCLYSHKGALGHSLGASGLVAVVLNVLAHERGTIPPNVRTTRPLATRGVLIDRETHRRPIRRSVALAAGFGGATAAVSLASI